MDKLKTIELNKEISFSEYTVIGSAFCFIVLGSYLSFNIKPLIFNDVNLTPVAEIKSGLGKRKTERSLSWEEIETKKVVYNNDQLFTNNESTISLEFKNKVGLEVDKNSLVKVVYSPKKLRLNLKDGSIVLKAKSKQNPVPTFIGKTQINIKKDTTIKLSKTNDVYSIDLLKGKAEIIQNKKVKSLKKGKIFFKNNKTITKKPIDFLTTENIDKTKTEIANTTPKYSRTKFVYVNSLENKKLIKLPINQGKLNVASLTPGKYTAYLTKSKLNYDNFEVTQSEPIFSINNIQTTFKEDKKNHLTKVTLDKDVDPKSHIVKFVNLKSNVVKDKVQISNKNVVAKNLAPANYKVEIFDKQSQKKLHESFIKVPDRIKITKSKSVVKNKKLKTNVNWNLASKAKDKNYEVVVLDQNKKVISKKITKKTTHDFSVKRPGLYTLKVGVVDSPEIVKTHTLKINLPKVNRPRVTAKQVMKYNKNKKCHEINIYDTKYSNKYYVEIYRDKAMTKMVLNKWLQEPKLCWRNYQDGEFFIRVKSFDYWNRSSSFSNLGKIIFPISPMTDF